ncbi:hypothetical protein GCM10022399_01850 [Terrabacter ginsenosidimutans]|uniref:Uncharacterized protein n=1 Tax=Terrabacter ginsenosidimutans TaxID=490575 RepID=A0ABP7CL21_9MICO
MGPVQTEQANQGSGKRPGSRPPPQRVENRGCRDSSAGDETEPVAAYPPLWHAHRQRGPKVPDIPPVGSLEPATGSAMVTSPAGARHPSEGDLEDHPPAEVLGTKQPRGRWRRTTVAPPATGDGAGSGPAVEGR